MERSIWRNIRPAWISGERVGGQGRSYKGCEVGRKAVETSKHTGRRRWSHCATKRSPYSTPIGPVNFQLPSPSQQDSFYTQPLPYLYCCFAPSLCCLDRIYFLFRYCLDQFGLLWGTNFVSTSLFLSSFDLLFRPNLSFALLLLCVLLSLFGPHFCHLLITWSL